MDKFTFCYSEEVAKKRTNDFVRELCKTFLNKIYDTEKAFTHSGFVTYGWGKSRTDYFFSVSGDEVHCITRNELRGIFNADRNTEFEKIKNLTTIKGGSVNE